MWDIHIPVECCSPGAFNGAGNTIELSNHQSQQSINYQSQEFSYFWLILGFFSSVVRLVMCYYVRVLYVWAYYALPYSVEWDFMGAETDRHGKSTNRGWRPFFSRRCSVVDDLNPGVEIFPWFIKSALHTSNTAMPARSFECSNFWMNPIKLNCTSNVCVTNYTYKYVRKIHTRKNATHPHHHHRLGLVFRVITHRRLKDALCSRSVVCYDFSFDQWFLNHRLKS